MSGHSKLDEMLAANPPTDWPEFSPEARGKTPEEANVRKVQFMDGPAEGKIHDLEQNWPVPDEMGSMRACSTDIE